MLGATFLFGVAASMAQQSSVPLVNFQQAVSVATQPNFFVGKIGPDKYTLSDSLSYSSSISQPLPPSEPLAEGMISRVAPVREHKILDRNYYLLNGLHLGMGLLDVGLTQHCIATHQCAEGNPLMPSSLAGQLSVNVAFVGYASFLSYNLKKRHSRLWWISPTSGMATHTVGVATGLMH